MVIEAQGSPIPLKHNFKPGNSRTREPLDNRDYDIGERERLKKQIQQEIALGDFENDQKIAISEAIGGSNNSIVVIGAKEDPETTELSPEENLHMVRFKFRADTEADIAAAKKTESVTAAKHDVAIARDIIHEVVKQASNCSKVVGELCMAGWHKGGAFDNEEDRSAWTDKEGFFAHKNRYIEDENFDPQDFGKEIPYNFGEAIQRRFDKDGLAVSTKVKLGIDGELSYPSKANKNANRSFEQTIQNDGTYGVESYRAMHGLQPEDTVVNIIMGSGFNVNIGADGHVENTEQGHLLRKDSLAMQEDWNEFGQYLEPQRVDGGYEQDKGKFDRFEMMVSGSDQDKNPFAGPKLTANNIVKAINGEESFDKATMLKLLNLDEATVKASNLYTATNESISSKALTSSAKIDGLEGEFAKAVLTNFARRSGAIIAKHFDNEVINEINGKAVDLRKAKAIGLTGGLAKGVFGQKAPTQFKQAFHAQLNKTRGDNPPLKADAIQTHNPVQDGAFMMALRRIGYQIQPKPKA